VKYFCSISIYVITMPQRHRQTDGQTTSLCIALCGKNH